MGCDDKVTDCSPSGMIAEDVLIRRVGIMTIPFGLQQLSSRIHGLH